MTNWLLIGGIHVLQTYLVIIVIIDFLWSTEIMMCIVKVRYNIQYGVNTMSTSIISTHVFFITFSQYSEIFFAKIRIRKSAPDTEL
jgi:hypothetical protein